MKVEEKDPEEVLKEKLEHLQSAASQYASQYLNTKLDLQILYAKALSDAEGNHFVALLCKDVSELTEKVIKICEVLELLIQKRVEHKVLVQLELDVRMVDKELQYVSTWAETFGYTLKRGKEKPRGKKRKETA